MRYEDLTPGQRKEMLAEGAPADILARARQEGYELTDEELDQVTGGADAWGDQKKIVIKCPSCGSDNVEPQGMHSYRCLNCHNVFNVN